MPLIANSRPYRANFAISTATDTTIVAAVAAKHSVVVNMVLAMASGQTVIWKSGTSVLSGAIEAGYTAGDSYAGLLETAVNEALIITSSAASAIDGHLTYVLLA